MVRGKLVLIICFGRGDLRAFEGDLMTQWTCDKDAKL